MLLGKARHGLAGLSEVRRGEVGRGRDSSLPRLSVCLVSSVSCTLRVMDLRRVVAAVCAVAGVVILAGFGWALLAAAVLLFAAAPPTQVKALGRWLGEVGRWAASAQRRAAITVMPPAVVLLAVGVGLVFGTGFGLVAGVGATLIVLGLSAGGLSLALGWNQGSEAR